MEAVREQVELARLCFQAGKTYIDSLEILRCKLAGVWYCARFECVLNALERDGYRLRAEYHERHALMTWLEIARLGAVTIWKHFVRRIQLHFFRLSSQPEINSKLNLPSYHIK